MTLAQVKGIQWTKTKILFTFFAFLFSIAVIFMSFLPLIDSTAPLTSLFTILVGLMHGIRLLEFIFLTTNGQWCVWLFGTYFLNLLGLYAFNYTEINEYIDQFSHKDE